MIKKPRDRLHATPVDDNDSPEKLSVSVLNLRYGAAKAAWKRAQISGLALAAIRDFETAMLKAWVDFKMVEKGTTRAAAEAWVANEYKVKPETLHSRVAKDRKKPKRKVGTHIDRSRP